MWLIEEFGRKIRIKLNRRTALYQRDYRKKTLKNKIILCGKKAKNVQIIILIFIIPNAGFLEMKIFLFVFVYDFVNMTPLRVLKHINIM